MSILYIGKHFRSSNIKIVSLPMLLFVLILVCWLLHYQALQVLSE